jgi:putative iron-only hydrogenase system regulator
MEKRIGNTLIVVDTDYPDSVKELNHILSDYSSIIHSRQGLSFKEKHLGIITIIFEGEINQINAMAGKIGKIHGVSIKTIFI